MESRRWSKFAVSNDSEREAWNSSSATRMHFSALHYSILMPYLACGCQHRLRSLLGRTTESPIHGAGTPKCGFWLIGRLTKEADVEIVNIVAQKWSASRKLLESAPISLGFWNLFTQCRLMGHINLAMATSPRSWIGTVITSHQPRSPSVAGDPFWDLEVADLHRLILGEHRQGRSNRQWRPRVLQILALL